MRKQFSCGHTGKGSYCHRCAAESKSRAVASEQKQAWEATVAAAPVKVDHLPKSIALKVLSTIESIQKGAHYTSFKGKRLEIDRSIISIPIGARHRLICTDKDGPVRIVEAVNHSTYDKRLSGLERKRCL